MIEFSAIWVQVTQVLPQLLLQWALAGLVGVMLLGALYAGLRRCCDWALARPAGRSAPQDTARPGAAWAGPVRRAARGPAGVEATR